MNPNGSINNDSVKNSAKSGKFEAKYFLIKNPINRKKSDEINPKKKNIDIIEFSYSGFLFNSSFEKTGNNNKLKTAAKEKGISTILKISEKLPTNDLSKYALTIS